jgi:hypothetical protein
MFHMSRFFSRSVLHLQAASSIPGPISRLGVSFVSVDVVTLADSAPSPRPSPVAHQQPSFLPWSAFPTPTAFFLIRPSCFPLGFFFVPFATFHTSLFFSHSVFHLQASSSIPGPITTLGVSFVSVDVATFTASAPSPGPSPVAHQQLSLLPCSI